MNRCADFLLRGVLGMVAGVRHAARHQLSYDLRLRPAPSTCTFALAPGRL